MKGQTMNTSNEYKMDTILSEFPVEETAEVMTMVADANQIDRSVKTYGYRNALAKLIHEEILFYISLNGLSSKLDDSLVDLKSNRELDREGIYGMDNPNEIQVHNLEDVKNMQDKLHDIIIGKLNMFVLRFGCSITECLTWTSSGKYGKNQTTVAKISQSSEYYALMMDSDMSGLYKDQMQSVSYKLNGMVDKLKQATVPPVKQYSMFEKEVMNRLVQAEDKVSKVEKEKFSRPIVQS